MLPNVTPVVELADKANELVDVVTILLKTSCTVIVRFEVVPAVIDVKPAANESFAGSPADIVAMKSREVSPADNARND